MPKFPILLLAVHSDFSFQAILKILKTKILKLLAFLFANLQISKFQPVQQMIVARLYIQLIIWLIDLRAQLPL